jgi:type II secretory pathway component GspD/PulD (secretin)
MFRTLRVALRVLLPFAACLSLATPLAAQTPAPGAAPKQPAQSAAPTRPPAQPAGNKDITLNFKDADIRQIIEAVAEATARTSSSTPASRAP